MIFVCNTTVLSNFAATHQLDCLKSLFQQIYMPTAVYEEIQNGIEEGYDFFEGIEKVVSPFTKSGWIQLTNVADDDGIRLLGMLPRNIHQGEAACLVVAKQRNGLFLTDDRAARKYARMWQIPLSGSLGCLRLAVDKGFYTLPEANGLLKQMINYGYRSPIVDLADLK